MKIAPRKLWGYHSPVTYRLGSFFSTDPQDVRKYCIRVGTVYGGKARGYRIVPVTVTVRKK